MTNSNSNTSVNVLHDSNKKCEKNFIFGVDINMYRLFRLIHITAKLFGLMTFSISYDSEKYPKHAFMSFYDIVLFLFFISFRAFSIWSFVIYFQLHFPTAIYVFLRGVTIICTILFTILIIDSICDVKNRQKLVKITQNIISIDSNLNLFGIKFNNYKHFWFISVITVLLMLAGISINLSSAYIYSNCISTRSVYIPFYRLGIVTLFNYGIAILVKNYLLCFIYVNSRLKSMEKFILEFQCQTRPRNIEFQIKVLRKNYDDLVDLVDIANRCFAFQVDLNIFFYL